MPFSPDSAHLVAIEGIDGSGKSTLVAGLRRVLADALYTSEPTHGPFGSELRAAFAQGRRLPAAVERNLVESDRRDHLRDLVLPALSAHRTVVLDRYYYSTAAYQGLSFEDARQIVRDNETFAPRPSLVLFIDTSPNLALVRIHARGSKPTAPEAYESLRACAERYEAIWSTPELMRGVQFIRLDASKEAEAVLASAVAAIGVDHA